MSNTIYFNKSISRALLGFCGFLMMIFWLVMLPFIVDAGCALEAVEYRGLPGGRGRALPLLVADHRPPPQV